MAFGRDGDFVFLDLTRAAFDLSDRGVGGRLAPGRSDVFLYTDRGVYRPGETVHLAALLRDRAGHAIKDAAAHAEDAPPRWRRGARADADEGQVGGFQQDLPISASARTGTWSA